MSDALVGAMIAGRIAKRIERSVRATIAARIARGEVVALGEVMAVALARHGARFGEDAVRDAARSTFLGYHAGPARAAP